MSSHHESPGPGLSGAAIRVRTDRVLVRAAGRSRRFVLVELTAPRAMPRAGAGRPPANLAFVLDRSGSMSGQAKLTLARQAVLEAVGRLEASDRFAVVVYDDLVDVLVPGTAASDESRHLAGRQLAAVQPRGSTDLHAGWLAGCEQAASGLREEAVSRVLLLTDGLANRGVRDSAALAELAGAMRQRGIGTSTFGVGSDFDEGLLQAMADAGGGHFYFVGDVAQMRDHITSEVGEALDVVARDSVLELVVPESVRVEALSPFRLEQAGGRVRVHLGDLVSGQLVQVILQVTFAEGEPGREAGMLVRASDRDGAFGDLAPELGPVSLAWRYAGHGAVDAQPRDAGVDRAVARLQAEHARQEAVRLNRSGRFQEAQELLAEVRRRVERHAGADPDLRELVADLSSEATAYAAPMAEMDRKARHFRASAASRMRDPEGRARRA